MCAFARAWSSSSSSRRAIRDGPRTVAVLVPSRHGGGDAKDVRFAVYARGRGETSAKRRRVVDARRRAMVMTIGSRLISACKRACPKAEETWERARAFGEKTWAAMGDAGWPSLKASSSSFTEVGGLGVGWVVDGGGFSTRFGA